MDEKNNTVSPSWILKFAGKKKLYYIFSVLIAIVGAICQVLPYLVIAGIITRLIGDCTDFSGYLTDCLIMAGIWLVRILCHSVSTTLSHVATFEVLSNMRRDGLLKLERMPLGDVLSRGSGDMKNTLVERIDSVETTLAHIIPEATSNIIAVILMAVYIFVISWKMGLASLITFPIGLVCYMLMMIGYEENYSRTIRATKDLNDTAVEYIGGIEVIKVFGKAKSSYERFVQAAKEAAASYVDWMRKCNVYFTFAMNIMPATLIAVLPIGGIMIMHETLAVEQLVQIIVIAMGLIQPIILVMSYSDDMAKLGTVLGEVASILDAKEMPRPEKNEEEPVDSTVRLNDVRFGYGPDKEILHGISAEFKAGTVNALVGPSGGGKSTIAKLIASFWDVDSGSVTVGGADIRKMSNDYYHSMIAYVSQDSFLFDDTVMENIRMGKMGATDEEVIQAARNCGCYDFIMNLENGFDTVVGGSGSHLSGGEKQRISIARAMLKDAPIVIFDEATAYTDPENEALIQSSAARLVKGKTVIVIAHRLSTITDADQIVLVNDGNIEATGTQDELLEKSELYRKLWESHISVKDSAEEEGSENV